VCLLAAPTVLGENPSTTIAFALDLGIRAASTLEAPVRVPLGLPRALPAAKRARHLLLLAIAGAHSLAAPGGP
jgi:hypothetical protein